MYISNGLLKRFVNVESLEPAIGRSSLDVVPLS